ncbi:MAG: ABC transporter ATP-binding protein [Nitrososphaerota archaeon]|nr:ABC transporter ATP-binding protein [Nitrososphaerota archaeon]
MSPPSEQDDIVRVENLTVVYRTVYGPLKSLNSVNFRVRRGESVSIVGESGSGKSTLGLAIVRLLPPNGYYQSGSLILDGKDMVGMSERAVRNVRGSSAFMIFQDPLNTLNPVKRVDVQMMEAIKSRCKQEGKHFDSDKARNEAIQKLSDVRMPDPEKIISRYPHELSGGQIQRVVISMGLLMRPKLMIADEPTSALDVTIQAQVMELMRELQREYNMSIIFITHDINVAHSISDRMVVMYAGEVIESAPTDEIVKSALHPYSEALIASIPRTTKRQGRLNAIAGSPPDMISPPEGCRFHPRCPRVMDVCHVRSPGVTRMDDDEVRCFLYG